MKRLQLITMLIFLVLASGCRPFEALEAPASAAPGVAPRPSSSPMDSQAYLAAQSLCERLAHEFESVAMAHDHIQEHLQGVQESCKGSDELLGRIEDHLADERALARLDEQVGSLSREAAAVSQDLDRFLAQTLPGIHLKPQNEKRVNASLRLPIERVAQLNQRLMELDEELRQLRAGEL